METEVILRLDEKIVERATRFSTIHGTSLDKLVEHFLAGLNDSGEEQSIVDRLSEVLSANIKIPIPEDYREFIRESRYHDMLAKMAARNED